MIKKIKCVICGTESLIDDVFDTHPFTKPVSEGANYYYNLWHFNVEMCPNCKYASKDISITDNKEIVLIEDYKNISNNAIIKKLYGARPNRLEHYLRAAKYYESIGDDLNSSICYLQAYDIVYGEIIYWKESIFDNEDGESEQNKIEKEEYTAFADNFYNKGIEYLKSYCKYHDTDYDMFLLLSGFLCDGTEVQRLEGINLIQKLKDTKGLIKKQKLALRFLMEILGNYILE